MAKINDLPLLSNPTSDMYCLVGKSDLNKVPWSAIQAQIGSPYIATTVAGMTDKTRVYVYQGSESGYTSGNWYYWNGSAWTSGGVYNSVGLSTDTTLNISGKAADSKTVGTKISALETKVNNIDTTTDTTLAVSGKPADSKTVGDKLSNLSTKDTELETSIQNVKKDVDNIDLSTDATLTVADKAADAKATGEKFTNTENEIANHDKLIGNLSKLKYTDTSSIEAILKEIYNRLLVPKPLDDIIGTDIPEVIISASNFDEMTKANPIDVKISYISDSVTWKGYANMKWQGSSSLSYPKKNFTVKFYSDETKTEKQKFNFTTPWGEWGNESKFVMKANYIDHSHARNIVSARIWSQIVKSRSDYLQLPEKYRKSPNNGAIDGFPIKVTVNGTYQGLYTMNIPKDAWMFNMDDSNGIDCVLSNEYNWNNQTSACEFRANAKIDGSDWSLEIPDELTTSISVSFNNLIDCIKDTDNDTFRYSVDYYLDVDSAIDYYIYCYFGGFVDSLARNLLMGTYDGTKWYCLMYDMDSTWGLDPEGDDWVDYNVSCPEGYREKYCLLWERLEYCFAKEIKERYTQLRANILSKENVVDKFTNFMNSIGDELYQKDLEVYPNIPGTDKNHLQQITDFVTKRMTYVDEQINALEEHEFTNVPVTRIEVSPTNVFFGGTGMTKYTIYPDNTTNKAVVYETSNPNIFIVDNTGIITPVGTGSAMLTVKSVSNNVSGKAQITVKEETFIDTFPVAVKDAWTKNTNISSENTVCYRSALDNSYKYYDAYYAIINNNLNTLDNIKSENYERKNYSEFLKNDSSDIYAISSYGNIDIRVPKTKVNSSDEMSAYIEQKPLGFEFTLDKTLYTYKSFHLANLQLWKLTNETTGTFISTSGIEFNTSTDERIGTYIESEDGKIAFKQGNVEGIGIVSSYGGAQVRINVNKELLGGDITVENLLTYLRNNNVRLVYIKKKN